MERFLITTESYIYAEDENKAKSLAKYIQGKQKLCILDHINQQHKNYS